VPAHGTPDLVLDSDQVDLVVNLTKPAPHADIAEAAIRHGKHVYNEKPLCLSSSRAQELGRLARERQVKLCSAPDTVLGAGVQTARQAIEDNLIGTIVGGAAFMTVPPPEIWHPSPFFLYQEGAGPLFDMGPYYVTALLHLLGPVRRVNGHAVKTFDVRSIPEGPHKDERIQVEVPTHVNAWLEFGPGFVASLMLSFDTHGSRTPFIEIFGSDGTISVPDPNYFDGPVEVKRYNSGEWRGVPLTNAWRENCRGLGVWEMAQAIEKGDRSRIEFESGVHVLEVMEKAIASSEQGKWQEITMQIGRPEPMPVDQSSRERYAQ
jgi:predicted dehydrogenase